MKQSKGLEKRALKAGKRAASRKGGQLSHEELLGIKIQIIPAWGRLFLFVTGVVLLVAGVCAWPYGNGLVRALEGISGVILISGGIFGLKKTLATVVDHIDLAHGADLLEPVAEGVGTAIGAVLDV